MKLPELAESASPEFTDAETCKRWLEHVPLANVSAAQRELATQLAEFNRFPTASAQRPAVMEALREAVSSVLMGMCSPNELAQRQLTFVAYLLERWASKLEVMAKPVDEGEGVPPLVADLESDACPERGAAESAREPRYLDARKLAKSLRNRV